MLSPARVLELLQALRHGTVPRRGLGALAVGLQPFSLALNDELAQVKAGSAQFKALRGEYGSGKTFFARWFQESAQDLGFATCEVQISETETPLHRLETLYRRLMEQLQTREFERGAFRGLLDSWLYDLEESLPDAEGLETSQASSRIEAEIERRLAPVSRVAPLFATAIRGYHRACHLGESQIAEGLAAWLAGQPNVAAASKRFAGIKGDIDHFGALGFLQGLLALLRDLGFAGLLIVLDEVETLQRARRDAREKSLNALRQWLDDIDQGRFPHLHLFITGTQSFFDSNRGVAALPPLAQRLHVDFLEPRFDNPRAVQIRLQGFDQRKLLEVGRKVRDLYASQSPNRERILRLADDALLANLAQALSGQLGGQVGVAPRLFLKKLVGEVLDRIDQYPDFEPRLHYRLILSEQELSSSERALREAQSPDEIELEL